MIRKILIANRGEIAVRIIRACREMNIGTVAVYSEADRDSMHVLMADEAVCIGPANASESYLNVRNILSAAVNTRCDALHPGFGFLSENQKFAQVLEECGIKFIGPSASIIGKMGDKAAARRAMQRAGVPVIPGSDGVVRDIREATKAGDKIGFPLLVKASAGGGGRGIRRVDKMEDLEHEFRLASEEAKTAFGDGSMYMEKLVSPARHVEIQILADAFGNVLHLFERDCSIQRRNQKVLEEAPCPTLGEDLRARMGEAAVRAARAVGYVNAGTIEFLLAGNEFYFMEMNTRIQVEHPVTEMITGLDIVKEQIRIAAELPLGMSQHDLDIDGHSIECRINAEDPAHDFRPCIGRIENLSVPGGPGVRFDSAMYSGYQIPPFYDSMIGKLIVHGHNREEALLRMKRSLMELVVDGVGTNIDFLLSLLENEQFDRGDYNTGFLKDIGVIV